MKVLEEEIPIKQPEGTDVHSVVNGVKWPFPTWIDSGLYRAEFIRADQLVVDMFNDLGEAIEKAMANDLGDCQTITFEYWRLPNPMAKKKKPLLLDAALYQHPEYEKF